MGPKAIGDFHIRLKEAAEEIGGLNRLSAELGVSRRTVGGWVSGETEPKASYCVAIAALTGVSISWLLLGEGEKSAASIHGSGRQKRHDILSLLDESSFVWLSTRLFEAAGCKARASTKTILEEIFRGYEFLRQNCDLNDYDEVDLHIKIIEHKLRKRLQNAGLSEECPVERPGET